ncbi:MAG TPA: polysaccharide deacetylase family protein [Gaiellaceae bacterium]|nr:polysaccharide deacetylase family protein [Gaiellaceae bacterium]
MSSTWPSTLAVPEHVVERHISLLRARAYEGLTLTEAERRRHKGKLRERTVVITFDDAFASTLAAKPILEAAGFPATVFVPTSFVDYGDRLSYVEPDGSSGTYADELITLSWEELAGLRDAGWEIGSHTVTHRRLLELDDADLWRELKESREVISERFGHCETVAYPYGLADARVSAAAKRAGYLAGCTLSPSHRIDEPFRRARVGLYRADTGLRFRAKLSPTLAKLRRTPLADLAQGIRSRFGALPS